jgi:hypothetical protein
MLFSLLFSIGTEIPVSNGSDYNVVKALEKEEEKDGLAGN